MQAWLRYSRAVSRVLENLLGNALMISGKKVDSWVHISCFDIILVNNESTGAAFLATERVVSEYLQEVVVS